MADKSKNINNTYMYLFVLVVVVVLLVGALFAYYRFQAQSGAKQAEESIMQNITQAASDDSKSLEKDLEDLSKDLTVDDEKDLQVQNP